MQSSNVMSLNRYEQLYHYFRLYLLYITYQTLIIYFSGYRRRISGLKPTELLSVSPCEGWIEGGLSVVDCQVIVQKSRLWTCNMSGECHTPCSFKTSCRFRKREGAVHCTKDKLCHHYPTLQTFSVAVRIH